MIVVRFENREKKCHNNVFFLFAACVVGRFLLLLTRLLKIGLALNYKSDRCIMGVYVPEKNDAKKCEEILVRPQVCHT